MIGIKDGSLFDAPNGFICHQTNCIGVMGKGVAREFKKKFPLTFQEYHYKCKEKGYSLLGTNFYELENNYFTVCMFAQLNVTTSGTDYDAFRKCCKDLNIVAAGQTVNMPYKIGCGLGGGDWSIVYKILEEEMTDCNVVLWKLEK